MQILPASWMLTRNGSTKDGPTFEPESSNMTSGQVIPSRTSKRKPMLSLHNNHDLCRESRQECHVATDLESSLSFASDTSAMNSDADTESVDIQRVPRKTRSKNMPFLIAAVALSAGVFALIAKSNEQFLEPTSAARSAFSQSTDACKLSAPCNNEAAAEKLSSPVSADPADMSRTTYRSWLGSYHDDDARPLPTVQRNLQWKDFQGLLINVGSDRVHNDSQGNEWIGDSVDNSIIASGGIVGEDNCQNPVYKSAMDDNLFCTGRVNQPSFTLSGIPRGAYVVTVHFTYPTNKRNSFEVFMNKLRVFKNLPSRKVEPFAALSISVEAAVKERRLLEIAFSGLQTEPRIHAIEIHKANSDKESVTTNLTYVPGLLSREQSGLLVSEGLKVSLIATANQTVIYSDGNSSPDAFHEEPDAGSTFVDKRPENEGGWVYVSNSEVRPFEGNGRPGGVGAITFDRHGKVIDYRLLLRNTRSNCGGGRTPWNTWISCEEVPNGQIYQVDPLGLRAPEKITMGTIFPGKYESFAYDSRDPANPHFFVTKDEEDGELRRFSPSLRAHNESRVDPWNLLTGDGTLNYLVLTPSSGDPNVGTFRWSPHRPEGSANAKLYYPNTEGIDVFDNQLFFVSKVMKRLVILDLDANTFVFRTTRSGLLNGEPDQVLKLSGGGGSRTGDPSMLYFTEDGGQYAGIHGRDSKGQFFTILESHIYADETTGLSFSPDLKHLYVAYQHNGLLFDIQRQDGLSFQATPLNIKYHNNRFSLST